MYVFKGLTVAKFHCLKASLLVSLSTFIKNFKIEQRASFSEILSESELCIKQTDRPEELIFDPHMLCIVVNILYAQGYMQTNCFGDFSIDHNKLKYTKTTSVEPVIYKSVLTFYLV